MIKEIAFTGYPADDMARARKFYEGVLGLAVESDFGGQWFEYGIAGGTFAITTMMELGQRGTRQPSLAFEVDDFAAAVDALRQAGARLRHEPLETPVGHMAVVADPDGNEVIIHRRKS
ncbi:MAG: VOC family protein [Verrucomicrobia bacterium]|jgi:predicted enzyme related to lactoylglutathione lyase|nr:VOC family protein [Verrucomicrobiota bacterium]